MNAPDPSRSDGKAAPEAPRPGRRLGAVALAIMLACLAARPLLSELPYDMATIRPARSRDGSGPTVGARNANPSQFVRVALACVLLSAAGLWALGQARSGRIEISHGWLGAAIAVFALWSLASTLGAADQRAAWTGWIEQLSLLTACFVTVQLCRRRRARDLLLAAAVAACVVLVTKSAWQMAFEFPVSRAQWHQRSAEMLRDAGYEPGSVDAELLAGRMLANTPYGFMSLSNPFASMMIVLGFAAAALAVEKFAAAGAARPPPETVRKGHIHLPALAAGLTAAVAGGAVVVVLLTRSRGAIAAMAAAVAGAGVAYRYRRALGAHWRGAMLIAAGAVVVVVAAVAAYGLGRDRLPGRTMTFRWYYWTGSARIIAEGQPFGTGGGNFANAYLRHRRVEAEEAIKMPHNFAIHALCQYGIVGGVCFVAIVVYVLAASARPGGWTTAGQVADGGTETRKVAGGRRPVAAMFVGAAGLALMGRWLFGDTGGGAVMFVLNAVGPTVLLAGALGFAWWRGGAGSVTGPMSGPARILLVCGLAGFVLHNGVTFSMWVSGPATVFWILAGVCLSQAPAPRRWRLVRLRWPVAVLTAGGAASALLLCGPVLNAYRLTAAMSARVKARDMNGAVSLAARAARADPSSVTAAIDAAVLAGHAAANAPDPPRRDELADEAMHWARQGPLRDETSPAARKVAGEILFRLGGTGRQWREALGHLRRATELDPMNMRLRLSYATCLAEAGRTERCAAQLRQVLHIDSRLPEREPGKGSAMRLTDAERARMARLWRLIAAAPPEL